MTKKTNPFGPSTSSLTTQQEPMGFIEPRGEGDRSGYSNSHHGRGFGRGSQIFQKGNLKKSIKRNADFTKKLNYKCSIQFGHNHLQSCPAEDKNLF